MFQYDEKGVENMLLRIAVCDDEAIHRLIIRDKLDAYAISNDIDYELDEFTNSKELMKIALFLLTKLFILNLIKERELFIQKSKCMKQVLH